MSETVNDYPAWHSFESNKSKSGFGCGLPCFSKRQPQSRKKALIIGINYTGTDDQLKGCVNDARMMKEYLKEKSFYDSPHTMVSLTDTAKDRSFHPTKENILKGLRWLVAGAAPGDTLFFHYSGHGDQTIDWSSEEKDGTDEAIVPLDYLETGLIKDDDIHHHLVKKVPNGCRLYALADCCHSGTLFDLRLEWKSGWTWMKDDEEMHKPIVGDIILFSGSLDAQTSAGFVEKKEMLGVMTSTFLSCARKEEDQTIGEFFKAISKEIKANGFDQVPQLSSSLRWDPFERKLEFEQDIVEGPENLAE